MTLTLYIMLGATLIVLSVLLFQISAVLRQQKTEWRSLERLLKEDFALHRQEVGQKIRENRDDLSQQLVEFRTAFVTQQQQVSTLQKDQLDSVGKQVKGLTDSHERRGEQFRSMVEKRLQALQDDNSQKLEKMRQTVDEKLHATLEKRLGESFKLVGDRLELVHKGLGEMQTLASGVGDLKKVLTNVKTRGAWGEIQLDNLLSQLLIADQYQANVATKRGSRDFVEFAIRMPGRTEDPEDVVWLPLDAKCPQDPYQRLLDAQDAADPAAVETEGKQLEMMIKREAKSIRDKYLDPPHTTDFAVMFLPIEGMYAEVLRRPGLHDLLQREYRVLVAGPTTLAALLNSLQMGFRTLAIEKRSSEVWSVLGKVKTEFHKFGGLLDKTKKKLQEAGNVMEDVSVRSRAIERNLRGVEVLQDVSGESDTAELPLGL